MYNQTLHRHCHEFHEVEKSIEVVVSIAGQSQRIRIEALRDVKAGDYWTRAYIRKHVTLQPTYHQDDGKLAKVPEKFWIWTAYEIPWTSENSAAAALSQALGWLKGRCSPCSGNATT